MPRPILDPCRGRPAAWESGIRSWPLISLGLCLAAFAAAPDSAWAGPSPELKRFEYTGTEMAEALKIVVYAADEATAKNAAQSAIARIHDLNGVMSDYDPESELRKLCATAGSGKAVRVSDDLFRVLSEADAWSRRSDGAFDVTVGPLVRLWRRARRDHELPKPESIAAAMRTVGHQHVKLDPAARTIELTTPGMRLDLGGIAAGYAIDEALRVLQKHGIQRALVDLGGDIRLGQAPPDKPGWRIGVASLEPNAPPSRYLWLSDCAIETSGDAFQFVVIDGKRYSHIVDPRTGMGLTDHSGVTVVAPNGITCDALGTTVSVLGPEKGLRLVEDTPGAAAFILRAPEGKVQTFESKRWKELRAVDRKDEG